MIFGKKDEVSEKLLEELSGALILKRLKLPELRDFAAICEERSYEDGQLFVEQGALGSELHILLEGRARIVIRSPEGNEVQVSVVEQGDVFGEASIFMDLPRTASAVAKGPCRVAAVDRDKLFKYCEGNPKAGLRIFTFVIYSLLRRLGSTSHELAHERETSVTSADLERLMKSFPKSLEGILGD